MRSVIFAALLWTIALVSVADAAKADLARGARLHSTHCTACHGDMTGGDGSALYTRSQRLVSSLQHLKARVRYCQSGMDLAWSLQEIADVVKYLERRYYRFGG
jgi:mono/diheme cytochrome c family protein